MFHEELRAYCCRGNCAFRLSHMSLLKDLMLNEYCPELGRGMGELIRGGSGERLGDALTAPGMRSWMTMTGNPSFLRQRR